MSKLLEGLKVVDLTHVLAGPYSSYQLGLLGAEVIRIENPVASDLPRIIDPDPTRQRAGMGAGFLTSNANKSSVAIDITVPAGADLARTLIADADVVVENFRPGVLKKYGLDAERLTADHPRLIYCSISGFGQESSWKDRPAYDDIIQAMSGLMAITGTQESGPVMTGFPIIDYITGLMAAFAISAAVVKQQRTGQGEVIDVAMLDAAMSIMGPVFALQHIADTPIALRGNQSFSGSPFSGAYETSEGTLVLTANTPEQAKKLLTALQLEDLWANPKVQNWRANPDASELVASRVSAVFKTKTAEDWERLLNAASVPASKLRSMPETLNLPYMQERGFLHRVTVPALADEYPLPGVGFLAGGQNGYVESPPPALGEHTIEVLKAHGISPEQIAELSSAGVIGAPQTSNRAATQ